ncbi:MAG: hypothetical protein QXM92_03920, partial [Candidatus Anstonellales archaeon]
MSNARPKDSRERIDRTVNLIRKESGLVEALYSSLNVLSNLCKYISKHLLGSGTLLRVVPNQFTIFVVEVVGFIFVSIFVNRFRKNAVVIGNRLRAMENDMRKPPTFLVIFIILIIIPMLK